MGERKKSWILRKELFRGVSPWRTTRRAKHEKRRTVWGKTPWCALTGSCLVADSLSGISPSHYLISPFVKVLRDAGCVYQERLGWERPGWFSDQEKAPVSTAQSFTADRGLQNRSSLTIERLFWVHHMVAQTVGFFYVVAMGQNLLATTTLSSTHLLQALPYDYYGFYGNAQNENNFYKEKLEQDYTFGFPKHHDLVSRCVLCVAIEHHFAHMPGLLLQVAKFRCAVQENLRCCFLLRHYSLPV